MNERAYEVAKSHNPSVSGKFEGEPAWTVYYWECMMDGDGEPGSDDGITCFDVEPDEAANFDLPMGARVVLFTDDNGFAYGRVNPSKGVSQ